MARITDTYTNTVAAIDGWHEADAAKVPPRIGEIMGASDIGHHCDRFLWLKFRSMLMPKKIEGRILRLFRRGHREEAMVIEDLYNIGCLLEATPGGKQKYVDIGKFVGGYVDGVIKSGVPEAPTTPHLLEIKTHNDKSFKELQKKGVFKSKPQHWAQCQVYMYGLGLTRCLYIAINKNDDEYYVERFDYDKDAASKIIERGQTLATEARLPGGISTNPAWFQCKFCDFYDFCHGISNASIETWRHCRSCEHITPVIDSDGKTGTWFCKLYGENPPKDFLKIGCDNWELHSDVEKHLVAKVPF